MAKNRNHYFKVKPGDEERMLRGVDVQAVGLLHRLRIVTFDCDPPGFAVDHKRRPLDLAKLADTFDMSNGRFRAIFNELHERQLIQTADEFRAAILAAPGGWVKLKIDALHRLLKAFQTPLDQVFLVPTLVDDYLDTIVGQETVKLRGKGAGGASMPPIDAQAPSMPPIHAQISEVIVRDQNQSSKSEPSSDSSRERESSTAHARADQDERPMPWAVYSARCHDISIWQKRLGAASEERFAAEFEAEFRMSWNAWCEIKRLQEASIPSPCRDDHHVLDGDYCIYCPFIRAGETA